jgi:hypothetical protein
VVSRTDVKAAALERRPERAAPFLVVLWVTKSRRVSLYMEWIQTAPGRELTMVKNPPLWLLTTPSCLCDRLSEAWEAGRVRIAFLVAVFQVKPKRHPLPHLG